MSSDYEKRAVEILMEKGFSNIKRAFGEHFDLVAEKEGLRYCIEVKGTSLSGVTGRYTVPWHELKALYAHFLLKDKERALLMFVDSLGNYCIFQMIDGFMI